MELWKKKDGTLARNLRTTRAVRKEHQVAFVAFQTLPPPVQRQSKLQMLISNAL